MAQIDPQRELWRETRRQIQEYEARASELMLDLQGATKALATAKEEFSGLQREYESLRAAKEASDRSMIDEHDKIQALGRQRDAQLSESSRLVLQIASLRAEAEELHARAAQEEQQQESHTSELEVHLAKLKSYALSTGAETTGVTGGDAAARGAGTELARQGEAQDPANATGGGTAGEEAQGEDEPDGMQEDSQPQTLGSEGQGMEGLEHGDEPRSAHNLHTWIEMSGRDGIVDRHRRAI